LVALPSLGIEAYLLLKAIVAEQAENGRQLGAFCLFSLVNRKAARLEFFLAAGPTLVLFKMPEVFGYVCCSELRPRHVVEELT